MLTRRRIVENSTRPAAAALAVAMSAGLANAQVVVSDKFEPICRTCTKAVIVFEDAVPPVPLLPALSQALASFGASWLLRRASANA
ncbi:MAG: hypothetical protein AAGA15_00340 [Pseudomonadota bacterium]